MQIAPPHLPLDHPDRPLAAEEALHEAFYGIVSIDPRHVWEGDESTLWPLRRIAVDAGWGVDETDAAIGRLAATVPHAFSEGET